MYKCYLLNGYLISDYSVTYFLRPAETHSHVTNTVLLGSFPPQIPGPKAQISK